MKNALEYLGHQVTDAISGVSGVVVGVTIKLYEEPTVIIEREFVMGNGDMFDPLRLPIAQVLIDYDTMPKKNLLKQSEKDTHV